MCYLSFISLPDGEHRGENFAEAEPQESAQFMRGGLRGGCQQTLQSDATEGTLHAQGRCCQRHA